MHNEMPEFVRERESLTIPTELTIHEEERRQFVELEAGSAHCATPEVARNDQNSSTLHNRREIVDGAVGDVAAH